MIKHREFSNKKYKSDELSAGIELAEILYSLKEERETTNRMLATILKKIEELEIKIERLEGSKEEKKGQILGDKDEELLKFVRKKKKVTASEVQKHFKYKGRNGASSRLHKLYTMGLLEKVQAGRKVYYLIK